jgi:hypothetical protein
MNKPRPFICAARAPVARARPPPGGFQTIFTNSGLF